MQTTRYIVRPACSTGGRIARCAPAAARNMSYVPAAFHPRFGLPSADFNSMFRLLDESIRTLDNIFPQSPFSVSERHTISPRFDVREVDDAYELRGELPGVEAKDVEVNFVDPKTLVISGRTGRENTSGSPSQATAPEQPATHSVNAQAVDNSDAASNHSGSTYQKPSVEEEFVDVGEEAATNATRHATPVAETTVNAAANEAQQPATEDHQEPQQQQQPQPQPQSKYWVSERSVGSFSRTFSFAGPVDHDVVHASMKNGILNITVPKAKTPEPRRITVQ